MSYQMNQYRGTGGVEGNSNIINKFNNISTTYFEQKIGASSQAVFRDVAIVPTLNEGDTDTEVFVPGQDYYLRLSIPCDQNYDMEFDIKLVKQDADNEQLYQFLKHIVVPKKIGNSDTSYNVVLYQDPLDSNNTKVDIPIDIDKIQHEYEEQRNMSVADIYHQLQSLFNTIEGDLQPNPPIKDYVGTFITELNDNVISKGYILSKRNKETLKASVNNANQIITDETLRQNIRDAIDTIPNKEFKKEANHLYSQSAENDQGIEYIYTIQGENPGDISDKTIINYTDIIMIASWKEDTATGEIPVCNFEMIFSPVESGFKEIVLEMNRNGIDYNIQKTVKVEGQKEKEYFGRYVKINKINNKEFYKVELYKVYNLINQTSFPDYGTAPLSRIGVWGHPGMLMAINGEEIRIGPSGYYELDLLPIYSIGVAELSSNEVFTIDYAFDQKDKKVQTRVGEWHG